MQSKPTEPPPLINLVAPELCSHGGPSVRWRWLRADNPAHWREPAELPAFWPLTRYEDSRTAFRDHETFSSTHGILLRLADHGADPGGPESLPVRLTPCGA